MAKNLKIRILSACYQNGRACKVGDVLEVPEGTAKEAIWLKKAELFVPKEEDPEKGLGKKSGKGGAE